MKTRAEMIGTLHKAILERAAEAGGLGLSHWGPDIWERLLAEAEVIELKNGDILIHRDEAGDDLFFLVEGTLEVSVPQASSASMSPIIQVKPGSVVGEMAFLDDQKRSSSVWSRGPSVLFKLPHAAFDAFRKAEPEMTSDLLYAIARILARRLRRAQGGKSGTGRPIGPF